jgi:hypothetical protein
MAVNSRQFFNFRKGNIMSGATSSTSSVTQIGYGNDGGSTLGVSGGKFSFLGKAPTGIATMTVANTVTAGSTTTVCNNAVIELYTELVAKGMIV